MFEATEPTFTRRWPNGELTVDNWPVRMRVKTELFSYARPQEFERIGDLLMIRCANGEATYRVVETDPATGLLECIALRRTLWQEPGPGGGSATLR